jgi:hypothetical protein
MGVDPTVPMATFEETYACTRSAPCGHCDGCVGEEQVGIPAASSNSDMADNEESIPRWLPEIVVIDLPLHELVKKSYDVLVEANDPPQVFRRGMVLVRTTRDDEGRPFLRTMDHAALRWRLAHVADWRREAKDDTKPTHPSSVAASTLIAIADRLDNIPIVDHVVTAPVFAPDGTLVLDAGYAPAAKVTYEPTPGFEVPPVLAQPTAAAITKARELIVTELMGDFPFVGDAERAHAVALMLQPFVRPMIHGATPCFLLEAPTLARARDCWPTWRRCRRLGRRCRGWPKVGTTTNGANG